MTEALLKVLIPSLVATVTSLIVCIIAYIQFVKSQRNEQERFEKSLNRDLTSKLYDLRLEYYPKAFELTDEIYLEKGGCLEIERVKCVYEGIIEWRKGVISLIISVEARDSFFALRDALMKNPANGNQYTEEQIQKILNVTKNFRKQLRRDLGFLYREEKQRREDQ